MSTWEQRMAKRAHQYTDYSNEQIAKLSPSVFNRLVQAEATTQLGGDYDSAKHAWNTEPTESDATCRLCYKWKRFPVGQRRFGYAWWRQCAKSCTCEHHKDEVWIASAA